jgi:hypothetical protein
VTQGVQTWLDGTTLVVRIPMCFQRRGGRKRIVAPNGSELVPATKPHPDSALLKALARASRWQWTLDDGIYTTVSDIGDAENISKSYVSRGDRSRHRPGGIAGNMALDRPAEQRRRQERPLGTPRCNASSIRAAARSSGGRGPARDRGAAAVRTMAARAQRPAGGGMTPLGIGASPDIDRRQV